MSTRMNRPTSSGRETPVLFWASALAATQRRSHSAWNAPIAPNPQPETANREKRPRPTPSPPPSHVVAISMEEDEGSRSDAAPTPRPSSLSPNPNAPSARDLMRVKDVLPIGEALLNGALGPVGVDVELHGTLSLLSDPDGFERALLEMERSSCGTLRGVHDALQLFFIVRGESFYTLDPTACPPMAFLAKLLATPTVTKILLRAQLLYRLLFMFLGTDRVEVRSVVDVSVWSAVVGRVSGPHQRREIALCENMKDVWRLLPNTLRADIEARFAAVESPPTLNPPRAMPKRQNYGNSEKEGTVLTEKSNAKKQHVKKGKNGEDHATGETEDDTGNDEKEGGEARRGIKKERKDKETYNGEENKEVEEEDDDNDDEEEDENDLQGGAWSALTAGRLPAAELIRKRQSLAALHAFYDTHLRQLAVSGATETATTSLLEVCRMETYIAFLAEVMSYHGMFLDKVLLDRMMHDVDQQVGLLVDRGNAALRALDVPVGVDMDNIHIEELVHLLSTSHSENQDSSSGTPNSTVTLATRAQTPLQQLHALLDKERTGEEGGLAYIWLSIRERRDFKRVLWDSFTNGARIRARLVPTMSTSTSASTASTSTDASMSLYFSIHPHWSVHHATTGRLYCSRPPLQTLGKHPPTRRVVPPGTSSSTTFHFTSNEWTPRHLYGPPPGCSLLAFDFNQIELRVMAHLSGDAALLSHLRDGRDVLAEMALRILRLKSVSDVRPMQRQASKVVVYGLLYGMGPEQMDQRIQQLHHSQESCNVTPNKGEMPENSSSRRDMAFQPPAARDILRAFHECYPGVQGFLKATRLRAFHERRCVTINGVRDLSGEMDGNRRKQLAVALAVQGGAATILHHAMAEVHQRRHDLVPYFPASAIALVASVHDELIYVVPDAAVDMLALKIKDILEEQAEMMKLRVSLSVSVKRGKSLGTMESMDL